MACAGSAAPRDDQAKAEIQVLLLGNSHSSGAGLPGRLESMLRAGLGGPSVAVTLGPGWMFLDERARDGASRALLRSRPWSAVVLQAQKYSSSGRYSYPITGALALVAETRQVGGLPVLFPEWPRRGVSETARIHALHMRIASAAPACVAPMGQAFDLAAQRLPQLALHDDDGNHAGPAGAQLAALVLYATISGNSPRELPDTASDLDAATQHQLREIAAEAVAASPPRRTCPTDPAVAQPAASALSR